MIVFHPFIGDRARPCCMHDVEHTEAECDEMRFIEELIEVLCAPVDEVYTNRF